MDYTLINTLIASIVTAFVAGMAAKKMKLSPIFGYLIAGIAIGPHTPGFVADISMAKQLAEIGIILLMFGVGLHFSIRDLLDSRKIALPGALAQILSATAIGAILGISLGYDPIPSIIFGFSLSVASTIVLLRSLEQRKLLDSHEGKIAISWLIVEDVVMVLALVMIPVIAEIVSGDKVASFALISTTILTVFFKVGGFFAFMLIVGRRFLPWLLVSISKLHSAELKTLGTLAIALGFASIAYLVFDASLALGAFLAGVMLNESEIGRRSAGSSLPMRDAFSVLFFVSVGMLFEPSVLIKQPISVLMTFLIVVVAKSIAALAILRLFKQPPKVSYAVAIGLAQIGEFSFILGSLSITKNLIAPELYNLILAVAMLSIVANPLLFSLYDLKIGKKHKA
jgi:monovalent cation:H+ antiporter-2, CPA2 family